MKLVSQRLLIREFQLDDVRDAYDYASDEKVTRSASWTPHPDIEQTRVMIQRHIERNVWAIVLRGEDKVIGSISLHDDYARDIQDVKSMGFILNRSYWGRGLATEAAQMMLSYGFRQLGLQWISAYCYTFNPGSDKVLRKCRFIYEGTLRNETRLYTGEVADKACYSMTREEYDMKYPNQ